MFIEDLKSLIKKYNELQIENKTLKEELKKSKSAEPKIKKINKEIPSLF